jgi:Adenylate and Guanylate cyclase catalytic domain
MAIHTGEAIERDGDYFGPAVNRAARLMAMGHGGQVLVSHATEQLVQAAMPKGLDLVDLGEHRLRDLSKPERIYQLCAPGCASHFPPLRSLDVARNNLPVQLTSFIGREEDVKLVGGLLAEHRVVTLTGVGGVGKTRLALQAAAEELDAFPMAYGWSSWLRWASQAGSWRPWPPRCLSSRRPARRSNGRSSTR